MPRARRPYRNREAKTPRRARTGHGPGLVDPADRERALALTPVSRETLERLDRFVALLLAWQRATSLIAPSTVSHLWTRHIADSLQLLELAPDLGKRRLRGARGPDMVPGLLTPPTASARWR